MHCAVTLELFHLALPQVFVVKGPVGFDSKVSGIAGAGLEGKQLTLSL